MCPPVYYKPLILELRKNQDGTLSVFIYKYIYIYVYIYYAHLTSVRFELSVCHESLLTSFIYIYIYILQKYLL